MLAQLPLHGGHRRVDGREQVGCALCHPQDHAAGADGQLHFIAVFFYGEHQTGLRFGLKIALQLAHFFLRVTLNAVGQVDLLACKRKLHTFSSFRPASGRALGTGPPIPLGALYHISLSITISSQQISQKVSTFPPSQVQKGPEGIQRHPPAQIKPQQRTLIPVGPA